MDVFLYVYYFYGKVIFGVNSMVIVLIVKDYIVDNDFCYVDVFFMVVNNCMLVVFFLLKYVYVGLKFSIVCYFIYLLKKCKLIRIVM